MLVAGALILTLSLGIRHGFGLFLAPMSMANDWTREVFAFAIALQNLVWGIAQPFVGRLADRYGAGKAILIGSVLYALGLALMSQAQTGFGLSMTAGVLIGLGLSGTTFPIVFGAIARSTPPEKRSMAMGIAMSVGSLGQFAMLPGAMTLIDGIGWAAALIALAMMAPLSSALFEKPQGVAELSMTLREILAEVATHKGFWLLSFGFFVCGFQVVFIATHLPAYLVDNGLSVKTGAIVLALVGLFNIAGSYLAGLWGGKVRKPLLLVGIYIGRAVAITAFVWLPKSDLSAYIFGAVMGLLWLSTVPLTNATVAVVFGVRNMSMLGGIVFFFHQIGSFLGGWLGGRLYVQTGSYDTVWWLAVGLSVVAALVNLPIREQPVPRLVPAAA